MVDHWNEPGFPPVPDVLRVPEQKIVEELGEQALMVDLEWVGFDYYESPGVLYRMEKESTLLSPKPVEDRKAWAYLDLEWKECNPLTAMEGRYVDPFGAKRRQAELFLWKRPKGDALH